MIVLVLHIVTVLVCGGHILLRRHRQPESRVAWLVVVPVMPYLGAVAYLLLGQTSVGRKRMAALRHAFDSLARPEAAPGWGASANVPEALERYSPLFKVGESISGYPPVGAIRRG